MALDVTYERLDKVSAVVMVIGPLTLGTNLKILDTQLQQLIEDGVLRLILDLNGCPYADSSGLGVLMHTYGLMNAKTGVVRLCGASERISSILKMTHADTYLPCDSDRAASIAALGQ